LSFGISASAAGVSGGPRGEANFHLPIAVQPVRFSFPMSALYIIMLIGIVLVSLFLLLLVLMQRPKQEGLGATFGVDATNQMFGSRTTDVLQKTTTYFTVVFFLLALSLGLLNARETKNASRLGKDLAALPAPEAPAPPPPPAETTSPAVPVPAAPGAEAPITPALDEAPVTPAEESTPPAAETPATPEPAPAN